MKNSEKIAVMQKYEAGVSIEVRMVEDSDDNFVALSYPPTWNWEKYVYRVKPKNVERPKTIREAPLYRGFMIKSEQGFVNLSKHLHSMMSNETWYRVELYKSQEQIEREK